MKKVKKTKLQSLTNENFKLLSGNEMYAVNGGQKYIGPRSGTPKIGLSYGTPGGCANDCTVIEDRNND